MVENQTSWKRSLSMTNHQRSKKKTNHLEKMDEPGYKRELEKWQEELDRTRESGFQWSQSTTAAIVKRQLRKNPPSIYNVDERVRVRAKVPSRRKASKGKSGGELILEATVTEADHDSHVYKVLYTINGEDITYNCPVDKITSLTQAEERVRQIKARKNLIVSADENRKGKRTRECLCSSECTKRRAVNCSYGLNGQCCKIHQKDKPCAIKSHNQVFTQQNSICGSPEDQSSKALSPVPFSMIHEPLPVVSGIFQCLEVPSPTNETGASSEIDFDTWESIEVSWPFTSNETAKPWEDHQTDLRKLNKRFCVNIKKIL
eukprot:m.153025 g.153025  ORF g.153025 m.153025 type:complete len:317 (+) comp38614_c0_seq6:925-1875(+)